MGKALAPAPRSSFLRYWSAAAISSFGSAVTAVAMPVLVIQILSATPFEVGVVNAAQFLPYALLGLIAGVYTDRWRRKSVLVWASVGRALSLSAVPVLWLIGVLQIWILVIALLLFGAFSVFGFAATQSLLPRLVPRARLVSANARLDQADAAATTLGPAIGGGLVGLLGAPVAIALDAISYLIDAALNASIRVDEPRPDSRTRNLRAEIRDGLQWTYRHRTLRPLAVSTHIWFLANGAAMTALSLLALRSLGFTAYSFGMLLTVFGITSLIGASIAPRFGAWIGSGRVIILARVAYPIVWLLVAVAPPTGVGDALLFAALGLQGLAAGIENSNEMGYWQILTPDELLGRVNATRRSINRTTAALGALIAGLLVGLIGDRPTLTVAIIAFAGAALIAASSPLREPPNSDWPPQCNSAQP
ncbi:MULTISPECIES: MFS transporter [unclassified Mycolicibacterium]|uniref:MFS transporter n=1 Tax=unclassified Mycolicibacterium TaxID=2636767 RepID=UPI0012DDC464|nr:MULTISPECIES: MFS transporter [unclassified Mycolicibacterium]MUL85691.1 MFS transporter [Mycolicibacterium sp. CBMA 329]MUL91568.1 MFS transporter [Mycolicibacterium sp. CBMA 331]MUM02192.1 MFS transporter [Mycolicibacterium sp. CBMA 334]MUM41142.1 MFS transporter [Mycolicibacterium sp. CBMA 247]MUM47523.1 MFS transporter [Mycolicibacterium sp. CBMA 294]